MRSELRLLAVAALTLAPAPGRAETIERVLAVVQERPVLLSEVRVVQLVRGLLPDQALEALIDERLMYEQASRLPQAAVTDAEVERGVAGLLAARPELATPLTPLDLARLVRRQASILKFVEFRLRPQVRLADDLPEAERAAQLRKGLDERIEAWVKDLRAGAEIRYNRETDDAGAGS
jgi:hypothetical protein